MNPSISRFVSAKADSKSIEEPFTAPVIAADDGYPFITLVETLADYRTESGESYYHTFSLYDDAHASWGHLGTTCLSLGYGLDHAAQVAEVLDDADILHYRIPIVARRAKATLFSFPSDDHFSHTDTTRAASILAHGIGVKGVLKNTYFSTYFFRFQEGAKVTQHGKDIINRDIIDDNHGLFVRMSDWLV